MGGGQWGDTGRLPRGRAGVESEQGVWEGGCLSRMRNSKNRREDPRKWFAAHQQRTTLGGSSY